MAIPSYWATDFLKVTTAVFTDCTDLLSAIRTALTSTLPVASRWTESPTNGYTSPADPISGNQINMQFTRGTAFRLQMSCNQIVSSVGTNMTQGEMDFVTSAQANIFCGPKHFWCEYTVAGGDFMGAVYVDPTPESPSSLTTVGFCKMAKNIAPADFDLHADYWHGVDANVDGGFILRARAQGPWYPVNGNTCQLITAGGSFVYFPVVGVTYPTLSSNANQRFCGTFPQFVWVDQTFVGGNLVSVPIDVGVTGVFQVVSSKCITSNGAQGPRLAVRAG